LNDASQHLPLHGESLYIASGKEREHMAAAPDASTEGSHRRK